MQHTDVMRRYTSLFVGDNSRHYMYKLQLHFNKLFLLLSLCLLKKNELGCLV